MRSINVLARPPVLATLSSQQHHTNMRACHRAPSLTPACPLPPSPPTHTASRDDVRLVTTTGTSSVFCGRYGSRPMASSSERTKPECVMTGMTCGGFCGGDGGAVDRGVNARWQRPATSSGPECKVSDYGVGDNGWVAMRLAYLTKGPPWRRRQVKASVLANSWSDTGGKAHKGAACFLHCL